MDPCLNQKRHNISLVRTTVGAVQFERYALLEITDGKAKLCLL